ncbi:MAG: RIP metalloprotease RseP [Candidatus Omnitrophica bacterium]|nr:RIP metalloprotease RseP [Candidatus Omnitrophota bacterium]
MLTDQVFEILLDALNFILVLGIAVVIHEAGHFIVARLSGIRVEKFSIGFGKPLASIRRGETEYILAPIPMGGYVKLAGDNPAEITGKQDEFYSISPWRRIPTVIAGPGANIIGAFLILFSLAYLFGTPYDYNIVGSVIPGSLEAKAGLQKNDVLLSVNGIEVRTWDEYLSEIQSLRKSGKEAASVEVRRGTKTLSVSLPVSMKEIDKCLVLSFVDPVGPGFAAGLETGDRILSIDHQSPDTWSKFREITTNLLEETPQGPVPRTVSLSWQNTNGEIKSASITPALVKNETGEHTASSGCRAGRCRDLSQSPSCCRKDRTRLSGSGY